MSPCGKEINYLKIDDPIACCVFGSLKEQRGEWILGIGGSEISQPFSPLHLLVDQESGRFYHEITVHRHLKGKIGLLQGLISQQLSSVISFSEELERFVILWEGRTIPIRSMDSRHL